MGIPIGSKLRSGISMGLRLLLVSRGLRIGGNDRLMYLWDVESAKELYKFNDHSSAVNQVCFLPGNNCNFVS